MFCFVCRYIDIGKESFNFLGVFIMPVPLAPYPTPPAPYTPPSNGIYVNVPFLVDVVLSFCLVDEKIAKKS